MATLSSGQKLRALPEKAGLSHEEAKRDPSADPVLEADGSLHPRQQNAAEEELLIKHRVGRAVTTLNADRVRRTALGGGSARRFGQALEWRHVHLECRADVSPPVPPFVEVWRSVRSGGDTKPQSRGTLGFPSRCIEVLLLQQAQEAVERAAAGSSWQEHGLVFPTRVGTTTNAANVRRELRRALRLVPNLDASDWAPRELRHSFVSLLSDAGVPIEETHASWVTAAQA